MSINPFDEAPRDYGSVTGKGAGFVQRRDDDFPRLKQEVSDACYEISRQTNQLRQLSKQIGSRRDDQELRSDIHELRKAAFQRVEDTAELFSTVLQSYSHSADRGQEIAIGQLRQSFDKTAKEFGAVYEQTVNRLSSNPRPTITSSMAVDDDYSVDSRRDDDAAYDDREQASLIQQKHDVNASYAEERAKQMENLNEDITQLHGIMGSIQRMVVEDGETIDAIETHVERAANDVGSGRGQLGMAVRYKKCNRRLSVIIVLVVVGVVLAIVIVSVIFACGVAHACSSGKK